MVRAMPDDGSNNRPAAAPKKTGAASRAKSGKAQGLKAAGPKAKSEDRQARLAEALRANLRRRKAPNPILHSGHDKKDG